MTVAAPPETDGTIPISSIGQAHCEVLGLRAKALPNRSCRPSPRLNDEDIAALALFQTAKKPISHGGD
jgi:hypothetical protein